MKRASWQQGFSYVEVLVAVALLVIIAQPFGEALRTALATTNANVNDTANYYALLKVTEDTLTRDYSSLNAVAGSHTSVARTTTTDNGDAVNVYVCAYDGDNADRDNDPFTGTDDGLLWIKVELAGTALSFESLKAQ